MGHDTVIKSNITCQNNFNVENNDTDDDSDNDEEFQECNREIQHSQDSLDHNIKDNMQTTHEQQGLHLVDKSAVESFPTNMINSVEMEETISMQAYSNDQQRQSSCDKTSTNPAVPSGCEPLKETENTFIHKGSLHVTKLQQTLQSHLAVNR